MEEKCAEKLLKFFSERGEGKVLNGGSCLRKCGIFWYIQLQVFVILFLPIT
jgi:hypothetical protein